MIRGAPGPSLCHVDGDWRIRRDGDGLVVVLKGAAAGYGGDRKRPVAGGAVHGLPPCRGACLRRNWRSAPPRNGQTPG